MLKVMCPSCQRKFQIADPGPEGTVIGCTCGQKFRAGGTGSTPGSVIGDQQFLNKEQHGTTAHSGAKAHHEPTAHHEPKGRHHRATKKPNK